MFFVLCNMQKTYSLLLMAFICLLAGCVNEENRQVKSENDLDAARNFIRAALDGKFDKAREFLLPDSVNTNWMDVAERSYQKNDEETKRSYRSSSINIHQVKPVDDSTTVVIFSNSFKNDHDTLKVLKKNGQWLIDLKYLFVHDMDSALAIPVKKDTIQ